MDQPERHVIEERELLGFKYSKKIRKLLAPIHDAGCARDRAHNRTLHLDEYLTLFLLFMFNPICQSLRSLQQASRGPWANVVAPVATGASDRPPQRLLTHRRRRL